MAALIKRFIGSNTYTLDNKGRVSIPAEFRDVLADRYDEQLVLMKHYDRCLVAYPMEEWNKLDAKISELPQSNPKVIKYLRHFYSSARVCELDKQGRILVPSHLKAHAGLSKDVMIVGIGNKMELWDLDTWNRSNPEEDFSALGSDMAELGI